MRSERGGAVMVELDPPFILKRTCYLGHIDIGICTYGINTHGFDAAYDIVAPALRNAILSLATGALWIPQN